MNWRRNLKRFLSLGLAALLAGTTTQTGTLAAYALTASNARTSVLARSPIIAFEELPEDIRMQDLPVGAEESEICFPDTLTFTVETLGDVREIPEATPGSARGEEKGRKASPSSATPSDSILYEDGELLDGDVFDDIHEWYEETVVLEDVEWKMDDASGGQDSFSSETAGESFYYVPVIPKEYEPGDGVKLPGITVTIGEGSEVLYPAFEMSETIDDVIITVSAEEGIFPEGAKLAVEKISEALAEEAEAAAAEQREAGRKVAASYTFDIRVEDKDGNELQPEDGQKVRVSFSMKEAGDRNLDASIYHITDQSIADQSVTEQSITEQNDAGEIEEGLRGLKKTAPAEKAAHAEPEDTKEAYGSGILTAEKLDTEADAATGIIAAETDGFSLYTVEFTYNDLQYVMEGGTVIPLADILAKVGLTGEVSGVEVSNERLFSAKKKDGEWVILSHEPFSSEEWMKVTINDIVYEIAVTDATTVTTWSGLKEALGNGGEITLGNNITISQQESSDGKYLFVFDGKTAVLDLNGKTLTGGGSNAVIHVNSGGILTIKDSSSAKTGKITGADRYGAGGALEVRGECTLQSGTLSGNKAYNGGGVQVYGKFTMNGGTISNNDGAKNSDYSGDGGGVSVSNGGIFIMNNGTITDNDCGSNRDGGGVAVEAGGSFTMNNGTISNNRAPGSNAWGGGVRNHGTFTMNGGSITGNDSEGYGGGVYNSGTFKMTGGSITNNTASINAGGLYAGGTQDSNYLQGSINISGNKKGSANNNVFTYRWLNISGTLSNSTPIGITTNTSPQYPSSAHADGLVVIFTSGLNGKGNISKFTPDEDLHAVITYSDSTYTNEAAMSLQYIVTVTPVTNSHMTKTSGTNPQTVTMESAISSIVYTADTGYHFPTSYASLGTTNGLTVARTSDTKITISGTPSYGSANVNLSLAAASPISATAPTITGPSAVSMTYGDTGKTVSVTATAASGHTITGYQWYHNTTNSNTGGTAVSNATLASYSIPQKTTAGTHYYYCVVSTKRTDNGQTTTKASSAAAVTVAKKTVTLTWGTSTFTYNGNTQTPTATAGGVVSGDTCTVTVTGGQKNAGTYTATASGLTGTGSGNYQLPSAKTHSFTINKKTVTLTWGTSTFTYNGNTQTPTATAGGVVSGDTCTVTVTGGQKNAGTYTATASGLTGTGSGNYQLPSANTKSFTINRRNVTVSGITASNKVYNGNTTATLVTTGAMFSGKLNADTLTVSGTGTFDNKNAGIGKTVTISGLTLGGTSAGNYQIAASGNQASTTANITPKAVTLTWSTDVFTYDGTPQAPAATAGSLVGSDTCTVNVTGERTAAGPGTATADSVSNTNYMLPSSGTTKAFTIDPRTVGLTWTNTTFTYDGGAHVPTATATGLVDGDTCTVTVDGAASQPGTHTATASGLSNSNYQLPSEKTQSFTIGVQTLKVVSGITAAGKVYDGTTAVTLDASSPVFDGLVTGDTVTVTAAGAFADADAGDGKTVIITGLTLGGTDAGKYVLDDSGSQGTATANITPKTVTLTWGTDVFTYNGTAQAPTVTAGDLVGSDTCTVNVTGARTAAGTGTAAAASVDNSNYRLPSSGTTKSFRIDPRTVGLTWTDTSFTYDGSTHVPKAAATGLVNGDTCTVTVDGAASQPGTHTATASGLSNSNYQLPSEKTQNFTIGMKTLKVVSGITAAGKVYDGTTAVTLNASSPVFNGLVSGDTVTVTAAGAFADADAGDGKTVIITGLTLGGTDAGKYVLDDSGSQGTATATISKAPLTVNMSGATKVYDGTPLTAEGTISGFVNNETATLNAAGTRTEVGTTSNTYGITWDGTAKEGNYEVTSETLGTLTVTEYAGEITAAAVGGTFTYDGKPHRAAVDVSTLPKGYTLVSAASSATATDVTLNSGGSAGSIPATVDTLVIRNASGTDVTDRLKITKTDGYITITPKEVTISGITAESRTYNGSTSVALNYNGVVISGLVAGDDLTVSGTGTCADEKSGKGKTVTISSLTLGGADAGNYRIASTGNQTTTTVDITGGSSGGGSGGGSGGSSGSSSHARPSVSSGGAWHQNGKDWTYNFADGHPAAGWNRVPYNGSIDWYFFDENNIMLTGWFTSNGSTYYLNPVSDGWRGAMYTGWHLILGKWYYFETEAGKDQGHLYRNTVTPDGYRVGEDGAWTGE